jgi:hypothetical protein
MSVKKNQPNYPSNFPGDTPRPFDPTTFEAESYGELPKSQPASPSQPLGLDFDSWADERISIFASLDAAMTRHIIEAVSALGELRRRAEEDARQAAREIDNERVYLQREIAELQQQKTGLQDELKQLRRDIDDESARIFAFRKETETLVSESVPASSNLSREVANLTQQMQFMAQQMQELLNQRRSDGVISYPEAAKTNGNGDKREPKTNGKERRTGANEIVRTVPKAEQSEIEKMMSLPLQEFSEAPTPRLRSNGKSKAAANIEMAAQPEIPADKPTEPFMNLNLADQLEIEEPDFFELFQKNEEKANQPPPDNKAARRQSNEAEQRVQRLLSKRSGQTGPLEPERASGGGEAADSGSPVEKQSRRKQDKAAMSEMGAKLGLDEINTPPPGDEIKFGHGFTPPPQPWQSPVWAEETPLTASLDDIFQTPPPVSDSPARIGELGPDFAVRWGDSHSLDALPPAPVFPTPPMRSTPAETKYPPYPMQPPPNGSPEPETEWADDVVTKITISNLQGLSLLMMEKVVRGLPGVRHVTVTDFRRGELEMEVRHQTALELDRVLPTLPDLKLKLISRDNGLNFEQIR